MKAATKGWLSAAVLTLSTTSFAQSPSAPIEEIVITPNRINVPLKKLATSVSVLDEASMQRYGNVNLVTVLRQLPGVSASNSGGAGQTTTLRVRGEEGFRTLAMFDGIRLSDPSNPQIASQLEHLLSSGIGRVELLRGPQGLGYGADAGGVLNLSSLRAGKGMQGSLHSEAGANDTQLYNAQLQGSNAVVDASVQASDFSTAGINAFVPDNTLADRDGYDNQTLHGRVALKFAPHWQAEVVARQVDGSTQFDNCYDVNTYALTHLCNAQFDQQATRAAVQYQSERSSQQLSFSSTDTERDSLANGVSTFTTQGELTRWDYVGSLQLQPQLQAVYGADHERATLEQRERSNSGYFAELLWEVTDAWITSAGLRHDDNDDFGAHTTYRLSSAYLVALANNDQLKWQASVGTGFRAPSPYEVAYNRGAFAYPPASAVTLQAEQSRGGEAGVEYTARAGWQLQAVLFNQYVDDLIEFDLANYSGYLQQAGRSRSRGVEVSGEFKLSEALSLSSNYTYNDSTLANGNARLRRPKQLANVGVNWQLLPQQLQANAFVRFASNSVDQNGAQRVALPAYAVLDVNVSYALARDWQLYARLENALDRQYREVFNYHTVGRTAFVGVRWMLGAR